LKYSFKKAGAWLQRSEQPKERAVIISIMLAIFGFAECLFWLFFASFLHFQAR
jgi:hypothetical protein